MEDDLVYFQCVKDHSRLRIRIISSGYHNEANCQFPRAIRACGRKYSAPPSAVKLAKGPAGKFFYRVQRKFIQTLDEKVTIDKVFGDEDCECVVCMDRDHEVVIVPCGHYCLCGECAQVIEKTSSKKCPMCRGDIELVVNRDQIQT